MVDMILPNGFSDFVFLRVGEESVMAAVVLFHVPWSPARIA
jgi:hypothetical protein